MPDDFDPYYQWLGISPKYQPPTHYRLLGLELFESNADVIQTAADQRMAHVRSFQGGPRAKRSQQILNELSAARLVLLNPPAKLDYDTQLRARLAAERAAAAQPQAAEPAADRWALDLAADVKAASRFAAAQAERLKLIQLKLPEAFRQLGADIYADRHFEDEYSHLYGEIVLADGQLRESQGEKTGWGKLASKLKNRAQLEAAQRRLHGAQEQLGRVAYSEHGAASGPRELVAAIEQLDERVQQLDEELARLEQSRSGRWVGPKWIAAAGAAALLLAVLGIARSLFEPVVLLALVAVAGYFGYRYWFAGKAKR